VNGARAAGGRVWAVGTTAARVLETVAAYAAPAVSVVSAVPAFSASSAVPPVFAASGEVVRAGTGWTDLFIRPPYTFRAIDALLTNFHLPRSTLLMLVAAFAGYEPTMAAYREAVAQGYRLYSYGDVMTVV